MATVSTTSILGSDSISASRTTINSNFLLLQNWINEYNNVFGIDSTNGILDLSVASTGRISAKTGKFDQIIVPSGGTALAQILSTGSASFVSVATTTLTASGVSTFGGIFTANNTATFNSTTNLFGSTTLNSAFTISEVGHFVGQNTTYATGATAGTAFPVSTTGGGGRATTVAIPYAITGLEDVIYAECGSGFYMSVGTTGSVASNLTTGTRITVINTGGTGGFIATGIQDSGSYYTGFNTLASYGNFPAAGITCDNLKPYQSALQLQWEPRVGQGTGTQEGSWVVLGSSNMTW